MPLQWTITATFFGSTGSPVGARQFVLIQDDAHATAPSVISCRRRKGVPTLKTRGIADEHGQTAESAAHGIETTSRDTARDLAQRSLRQGDRDYLRRGPVLSGGAA